MAMYMPTDSGGEFEMPPQGSYVAVCYRVVDLGTQQTEFNGEKKRQHKIMISWELPDEKMQDGRPFSIHQRYTFSSHEKATLRQHLEAWRGKRFEDHEFGPGGFDLAKLLGIPCLLTILHNRKGDKSYANIGSIAKLPKGTSIPQHSNDLMCFQIEPFNGEMFSKLSQGVQKVIMQSPEYQETMKRKNGGNEPYNDAGQQGPLDGDNWERGEEIPF